MFLIHNGGTLLLKMSHFQIHISTLIFCDLRIDLISQRIDLITNYQFYNQIY
jgi:hypothetical protein